MQRVWFINHRCAFFIYPLTFGGCTWSDKYENILIMDKFLEKYFTESCLSCSFQQSLFKYFSLFTLFDELYSKSSNHVCTPDAKLC